MCGLVRYFEVREAAIVVGHYHDSNVLCAV